MIFLGLYDGYVGFDFGDSSRRNVVAMVFMALYVDNKI